MRRGVLLLAAGASRRFGTGDKLLAPLGGRPLVGWALAALGPVPAERRVAVVASDAVADLARQAGFAPLMVPSGDQSASLRAGAGALADTDSLLVALGDMPRIGAADLAALVALAGVDAACMADGPLPMPPAVFPRAWFPELAALQGDRGAGALLRRIPDARRLKLPPGRLADIDTAADLAAIAQG